MKSPNCTGWCDQWPATAGGCGLTACPSKQGGLAIPYHEITARALVSAVDLIREVARCPHVWECKRSIDGRPLGTDAVVQIPTDLWDRLRAYLPEEERKP